MNQVMANPTDKKLSDAVPHYHCHHCFDRGYIRLRKLDETGRYGTGPWLIFDCEKCGGRGRKPTQQLTDEEKRAVDWFVHTQPPKEPFFLREGRFIKNPASWWEMIRFDLSEPYEDKYKASAIKCAVLCFNMFGGEEKELDLGEEKELPL